MNDKWIAVWDYVSGIDETKHPNFVVKRSEIRREVVETIDRLAKDALSCLPTADREARNALWQLSVAATARLAANDVPRDRFREVVRELVDGLEEDISVGREVRVRVALAKVKALLEAEK